MKSSPARTQRGFTLLELSTVLVLIALILVGGLATFTSSLQASQYNKTVERMDAIENALLSFAIANNRIPCPSDLTQTPSATYYGFEAGAGAGSSPATATGACTGASMVPLANFSAASGTAEGGVPTRALQLPDDYMYDGWGRRFRYAVDPTMTKTAALPASVSSPCSGSSPSAITVNDATGAARTTAAIYALISHGANGHGAYTSSAVALNAASVNADELTNCHCTSAGTARTYTPTYVEKVPTQDPANALDDFDDIVTFKEGWQMQAQNYPLSQTVAQCIYVLDYSNSRVEKFNSSGAYLSQFGSSGSGNGQFNGPQNVVLDASGNIWVADYVNQRVQEFSSSGTYLGQIGGTYGHANGQFDGVNSVAIDARGNIWVTDNFNERIQEFNSSGTYLAQLGCATGACASSTSNGQFTSPSDNAVDASGNIWTVEYYNNRMQEFNSSGTWLQTIGTPPCATSPASPYPACAPSTANGQFYTPTAVSIDSGGNIWTVEYDNNRVQEFNSSGTWQMTIGSVSGGSGNGQFSGPSGIAFDKSNNVWVADCRNNRVEEFSSSGTYLSQFGSSGSGNGQFSCPAAVAVSGR